ncbi:MAG: hypothetical protein MJA30_13055, partial [Cytophagales bacterium]|nr:hypothetical protein [Cytophagales bacterium]
RSSSWGVSTYYPPYHVNPTVQAVEHQQGLTHLALHTGTPPVALILVSENIAATPIQAVVKLDWSICSS